MPPNKPRPNYIPMSNIRSQAKGHWFDRDTMRFFRSRIPEYAVEGPGGIYFHSSERGPSGVRRYSVRRAIPAPGHTPHAVRYSIETVGDFQGFGSSRAASKAAIDLAMRRTPVAPGNTSHPVTGANPWR